MVNDVVIFNKYLFFTFFYFNKSIYNITYFFFFNHYLTFLFYTIFSFVINPFPSTIIVFLPKTLSFTCTSIFVITVSMVLVAFSFLYLVSIGGCYHYVIVIIFSFPFLSTLTISNYSITSIPLTSFSSQFQYLLNYY